MCSSTYKKTFKWEPDHINLDVELAYDHLWGKPMIKQVIISFTFKLSI